MKMTEIRIGTRGSALALAQATLVRDALLAADRSARMVVIETDGDRRAPDTAWGEGAFVAAIEQALLDGRVDVAVHSAKDVPTDEPPRLRIAGYLPRADARDALVVREDTTARSIDDLVSGSRVGTDSPRRTGFLRARRPDLAFHPLHGNVDTRLRRLAAGETDALILACAGLDRLGLSDRISVRLEPDVVPPAPGQGAIAIQIRSDDTWLDDVLAAIDDRPTRLAVEAERSFLHAMGGGCRAPIGALATVDGDRLALLGANLVSETALPVFRRQQSSSGDPAAAGRTLASSMAVGAAS
jgi:hydroxymethylbilane synthase